MTSKDKKIKQLRFICRRISISTKLRNFTNKFHIRTFKIINFFFKSTTFFTIKLYKLTKGFNNLNDRFILKLHLGEMSLGDRPGRAQDTFKMIAPDTDGRNISGGRFKETLSTRENSVNRIKFLRDMIDPRRNTFQRIFKNIFRRHFWGDWRTRHIFLNMLEEHKI